ncbi:MAG: TraR/DksA C4-type zinc finger protein [Nannocystaceae bacterium]|nr:TraR/DksA C4-type zinc finger protein [Nannocystaceae bacterium]
MDREPDPLTDEQIARLGAALRAHHERLESSLARGAAGTKPVDLDEPIGRLSRIDALAQREMNDAGRRTQQAELTQVKLALEAIEAGEYGVCRACDESIRFQRLQARPFSTVCIRCQSERERT